MPKFRVFTDTNVMLEATRVGCWMPLCGKYAVETVEKCVEETLTGNYLTPIQEKTLIRGLTARHKPSKRDIANLVLSHSQCQGLDDGELHLFSWLYAQKIIPDPLISTADKAAIRATNGLGWIGSLISLEELLRGSGAARTKIDTLKAHFRTSWLSNVRTNILLEM